MMQLKKIIHVNAFNMNCVGHIHHGLWAHPRDRSFEYNTLQYWLDLAKILEQGLFDSLFLADVIGYYDVYQNNTELTLREAIQLPVNNPWLLVSAMAAVTKHLGFGITSNIYAEQPYTFARTVSTLDHLTQGRMAWNIVTGYVDSGARGLGANSLAEHDSRYDRADEFLQLCYQLWENSWQDNAVVKDKQQRIYTHPDKVHSIHHEGSFYRTNAIHMCEPSPQRTPVLFQAGSSERGQQFAGQHAEAVFIGAPNPLSAQKTARALRQAAVNAGRQPEDVKIYVGIAVITGQTEREAQEKYQDYLHYANPEAGLAHFSASTGIDFAQFDLDEPITPNHSNAIQSTLPYVLGKTRRQLLEQFKLGSRYTTLIGDAQQVADYLEQWMDIGEIDGFNLSRVVVPETWQDFARFIVPELQNRGRYQTEYRTGTLREKLFGKQAYLPKNHYARRLKPTH